MRKALMALIAGSAIAFAACGETDTPVDPADPGAPGMETPMDPALETPAEGLPGAETPVP
jgi:hypothetical protein